MKVFKVWVDKYKQGEFDSFICAANSKEDIIEKAHHYKGQRFFNLVCDAPVWFNDCQGEIHIEELDLNAEKPYIACASYNDE